MICGKMWGFGGVLGVLRGLVGSVTGKRGVNGSITGTLSGVITYFYGGVFGH